MKNLYLSTLSVVIMALLVFVSCSSDDDNNGSGDGFLIGEWQECDSSGKIRNDASDNEVMHVFFLSNGTGKAWSVTKGKVDKYSTTFNYSCSYNNNSGVLSITTTSSYYTSDIGQTETVHFSYNNNILLLGEIYYIKK